MFYFKVDVLGHDGYSFMVASEHDLTDDEIIDKALEKELFLDDRDSEIAIIDNLVDDNDIKHFNDCKCLFILST